MQVLKKSKKERKKKEHELRERKLKINRCVHTEMELTTKIKIFSLVYFDEIGLKNK